MVTQTLLTQNQKLQRRIADLEVQNKALEERVAALESEVASLNKALEEAHSALLAQKRVGKRQAAPFSKGKKKDNPRQPGRKKGHQAARRPVPEKADREVDVPLAQPRCLHCGGELVQRKVMPQYQIDIPPVEPVVTRFKVETARCACCGKRAQGRAPQQISDALGAANIHFGPNLLSFAAEVKHAPGLPYSKVCRILERGFGIKVSPAALARASQRIAKKAEPTCKQLILDLRDEDVVGADETSWPLNGDKAWLLRGAISLRNSKETLSPETCAQDCKRLEATFDRLIQSVSPDEEDDETRRFAKLLRKQRHRLFLFLYNDAVPYTNNATERTLRPAVVIGLDIWREKI